MQHCDHGMFHELSIQTSMIDIVYSSKRKFETFSAAYVQRQMDSEQSLE